MTLPIQDSILHYSIGTKGTDLNQIPLGVCNIAGTLSPRHGFRLHDGFGAPCHCFRKGFIHFGKGIHLQRSLIVTVEPLPIFISLSGHLLVLFRS